MEWQPINLAEKLSREMFVIPKGLEHKAAAECGAMLVERVGTVNTGDVVSERTAASDAWAHRVTWLDVRQDRSFRHRDAPAARLTHAHPRP